MQKTNSKMTLKTCVVCGKKFSVLTSRKIKYCSKACAKIGKDEEKKTAEEIHKEAERIRMKYRLKKADAEYAKKFPRSAARTRVKNIQIDATNIAASLCRYY